MGITNDVPTTMYTLSFIKLDKTILEKRMGAVGLFEKCFQDCVAELVDAGSGPQKGLGGVFN
jgi:hypothetical protein